MLLGVSVRTRTASVLHVRELGTHTLYNAETCVCDPFMYIHYRTLVMQTHSRRTEITVTMKTKITTSSRGQYFHRRHHQHWQHHQHRFCRQRRGGVGRSNCPTLLDTSQQWWIRPTSSISCSTMTSTTDHPTVSPLQRYSCSRNPGM